MHVPVVLLEAQCLVEPRGRGIRRAQPEGGERAVGGGDDGAHEPPPDAEPPVRRQHVEVAHAADARIAGIRVDVEAARANQAAVHQGAEQGLARAVEAILSARPFLGEPAHESQAGLLALGDQGGQACVRQLTQALDARATRLAAHRRSTRAAASRPRQPSAYRPRWISNT